MKRRRQPRFSRAVIADARVTAANQGREVPAAERGAMLFLVLRLAWETDAFLGLMIYRAEARLRSLGVPVLPWILRRAAVAVAQIRIDPAAVLSPGIYVGHGQILVSGSAEVGARSVLAPFSELGPVEYGGGAPRVGTAARIGTGSSVLGAIEIGEGATIGANAVVRESVPAGSLCVGIPARVL
jgi:serine O-acetyltransferase